MPEGVVTLVQGWELTGGASLCRDLSPFACDRRAGIWIDRSALAHAGKLHRASPPGIACFCGNVTHIGAFRLPECREGRQRMKGGDAKHTGLRQ